MVTMISRQTVDCEGSVTTARIRIDRSCPCGTFDIAGKLVFKDGWFSHRIMHVRDGTSTNGLALTRQRRSNGALLAPTGGRFGFTCRIRSPAQFGRFIPWSRDTIMSTQVVSEPTATGGGSTGRLDCTGTKLDVGDHKMLTHRRPLLVVNPASFRRRTGSRCRSGTSRDSRSPDPTHL